MSNIVLIFPSGSAMKDVFVQSFEDERLHKRFEHGQTILNLLTMKTHCHKYEHASYWHGNS